MDSRKISISVEEDLLLIVDSERKKTGESRSGLIARLLRNWLESMQPCGRRSKKQQEPPR